MTRSTARRWIRPWQSWICQRRLCLIPAYREAYERERDAIRRGCTRDINKARAAKSAAIRENMRGTQQ